MGIENVKTAPVKVSFGGQVRYFKATMGTLGYLAKHHGSVQEALAVFADQASAQQMTDRYIQVFFDLVWSLLTKKADLDRDSLPDLIDLDDMGPIATALAQALRRGMPDSGAEAGPTEPPTT